jgi:transposase
VKLSRKRSRNGPDVGVDVGIKSLLVTSNNDTVGNPRWYRAGQRRLRVLQRRVSRRKKGSKNRRKAVLQLQRHHAKIANQRKDFLNKVAYKLITEHDRIALERLRITNMVKNRHLQRASWMRVGVLGATPHEQSGRSWPCGVPRQPRLHIKALLWL